MKILSIKGKNLASIEGEFTIDFTCNPLANAGLFAITGPTGSGKSTILDALCLALYDKTPRQKAARESNIKISDGDEKEKLSQSDSRLIMRKGCHEAFAEVSFVAVDGTRYCSNWSVRRARNKPSGNLQTSAIALYNIDSNQPIPGTKSELLNEIETLTGMTFDQFTRAVLLAQNEFTAFLKANQQEKADLLEKLTGTDIYSRISGVVFRKTKEAENWLNEVVLQIAHTKLLTEDELFQLQQALDESQTTISALNIKSTQLNHALQSGARIQSKQTQLETVTENHAKQTAVLNAAELQVQKAKEILQEKQKLKADAHPLIIQARELDTLLTAQQQPLKSASDDVQKAATELQNTQQEQSQNDKEIAKCALVISETHKWLKENEQRQPLAENSQTINARLSEATKEHREQKALTIKLQSLNKDKETLLQHRKATETSYADLTRVVVPVEKKIEELQPQLHQLKLQEQNHDDEKLNKSTEALQSAKSLLAKLIECHNTVTEQQGKVFSYNKQTTEIISRLEQVATEIPIAEARKDTSHAMYVQATLEASENVEKLRQLLKDEAACPVCGSTDHPYAGSYNLHHDTMAASKRLVDQYNHEYNLLVNEQNLLNSQISQLSADKQAITKELERKQTELSQLFSQWQTHPVKAHLPSPQDITLSEVAENAAQYAENIENKLAALKQESQQIVQLRNQIRSLEKEFNELNASAKQYHKEAEDLSKVIEKSKQDVLLLEQQIDQINDNINSCGLNLNQIKTDLNPYFFNEEWFVNWKSDPTSFKDSLDAFFLQWKEKTALLLEKDKLQHTLNERSGNLQQMIKLRTVNLETAGKKLQELRDSNALLLEERKQLFNGQAVQVVEDALNGAVSLAQADLDSSNKHCQQSSDSVKETAGTIRQIEADLDTFKQEYEEQMLLLSAWLSETDTDMATAAKTITESLKQATDHYSALSLSLKQDKMNKELCAGLLQEKQARSVIWEKWMKLNEIIGSADGKKFKLIAQKYTLESLLVYANQHLCELSPRYSLEIVPDTLALQVIDHYMADEIRSVHYLSGGESFLVSLALALALASLSGNRMCVESLFIDEGFGSLDPETLNVAMDALEKLHGNGRKVGVISHVQEMTERITTQIKVSRVSGGKSKIEIIGIS